MIRIDGYYLYRLATHIHPISEIKDGQTAKEIGYVLYIAEAALSTLLTSVLRLKNTVGPLQQFLDLIRGITQRLTSSEDVVITIYEVVSLREALNGFETVLSSELSISDFYLVSEKGGLNVRDLIFRAHEFFPEDLVLKVPVATRDVGQAMKCLAFELPTACGFHLFRVTEAVLRAYWDQVTDGKDRPNDNNMGTYLRELEKEGCADQVVLSALRDLKNLHRNPLIHPENSLDSMDEALALHGQVRAAVTWMLKAIPSPASASGGALGFAAAIVPQP